MIKTRNFTFTDNPKELTAERYFFFKKYYSASLQGCSLDSFVERCNEHSQKLALFASDGLSPEQVMKLLTEFENIKFGAYTELAEQNLNAYKAFSFLVYSINEKDYAYTEKERPVMLLYPIELKHFLGVVSDSLNESLKQAFPKLFHSKKEEKYLDFCKRQINTLDISNLDKNLLYLDRAKYGFELQDYERLNSSDADSVLNSKPSENIKALANALDKPYSEISNYSIFDYYVAYENLQNRAKHSNRGTANSRE